MRTSMTIGRLNHLSNYSSVKSFHPWENIVLKIQRS